MSAGLLQIGSIWPLLLIGLLLLIALVLVILSTLVRRAAEPPKESSTPQNAPDTAGAAALAQPSADLPAQGSIEPASVSFSRAIKFLRSIVSGRDFRYQIPWYLVIGDPGCGKSAVLTGSGTNLNPDERHGSGRKSLEWQFLDQGILIGVSGRYFRGISRDEHDWNKLLKLLQNNRPRRPLDGLVLTISATDLTGPAAYDETQLSARAARYAEALAQAQRTLGFTFPVYVIVTKCDEVPGFGAFCRELPGSTRDDIFGWSCPYNLEAAFTPDWIDEAFDSVAHDLQRLQSEIFVERPAITAPEDVFLFP